MGTNGEYVYYWHRIFGAAFVMLGLIGLLGYGAYHWIAPRPESVEATAAADSTTENVTRPNIQPQADRSDLLTESIGQELTEQTAKSVRPSGADASASFTRASTQTSEPRTPLPVEDPGALPAGDATTLAGLTPTPELGESVTEQIVQLPHNTAGTHNSNRTAESMLPDLGSEQIDSRAAPPETPAKTIEPERHADVNPAPVTKTLPAPDNETVVRVKQQGVTGANVKRFLLTGGISRREPYGDLSELRSNDQGTTSIYCFSELTGMQGQTVEYRWFFEDQLTATIPIGISGNRWRSYSSKLLTRYRTGAWRVELRDSNDTLLAAAEFVYAPE